MTDTNSGLNQTSVLTKINDVHAALKYYYSTPTNQHRTGDVWKDVPFIGIPNVEYLFAIVISPSCDLSHNKTPFLNLFPVMYIDDLFIMEGLQAMVKKVFATLINGSKLADIDKDFHKAHIDDYVESDRTYLDGLFNNELNIIRKAKEKEVDDLLYCASLENNRTTFRHKDIKSLLFQKTINEYYNEIITNRLDYYYFFPGHNEHELDHNCVALLRYPFSYQIELFNLAEKSDEASWPEIANIEHKAIYSKVSTIKYPLKILTLNKDVLHDLLTKFSRLYLRIGKRDFSAEFTSSQNPKYGE